MKSRLFVCLAAFFVFMDPQDLAIAAGPSDQDVAQAIERGMAFIKKQQEPGGNWSYAFNHNHNLGITALAGLALLENGADRLDPAVSSAEETIKVLAIRSNQTYDLALAILFLARVQGPGSGDGHGKNEALIRRLASRLDSGDQGGMWSYTVPFDAREESDEDKKTRRRRTSGEHRIQAAGDNSNTQFALLGMWAAGRHGFDPNEALESIDGHFRSTENQDGHWGYLPNQWGTESMTCAGLMGLAIGAARPHLAERQTARARGAALANDPIFTSALAAVTNDAKRIGPQSEIYYLWSLERVCVALGLRQLSGFDWYATGAAELLRRQREDGSWPDERWGSLPNSCLALLFLRKANLAFELDRVLRLPTVVTTVALQNEPTPAPEAGPAPDPAAKPVGMGEGDDASVVITSASQFNFPEISVEFEVKRPDGSFLLDGRREDFRVTEYDQDVPIQSLDSPLTLTSHPTTVVLVVDRSLSMQQEDRMSHLKRAVGPFLKGLPKGSRVAVIAFGSEVELLTPFTDDFSKVSEAVETLSPFGATRYYDAVAEALELLQSQTGRRAVLALTDGEDTFSQTATLDNVILMANRMGLPVHTLGLGTEDEIESDALRRLATSTRGQYYPARDAAQLRSIYEELAKRLRSTYTLTYKTDRKLPDGTLRPVRIYFKASRKAGETAVFVHGMVVPAAGWNHLFLILVGGLITLTIIPSRLLRRKSSR